MVLEWVYAASSNFDLAYVVSGRIPAPRIIWCCLAALRRERAQDVLDCHFSIRSGLPSMHSLHVSKDSLQYDHVGGWSLPIMDQLPSSFKPGTRAGTTVVLMLLVIRQQAVIIGRLSFTSLSSDSCAKSWPGVCAPSCRPCTSRCSATYLKSPAMSSS
jgi:hypothetical protein